MAGEAFPRAVRLSLETFDGLLGDAAGRGRGQWHSQTGGTWLKNPTVLFEVLSPETEARDRNDEWQVYRQRTSLEHYGLVARDTPRVEAFDRVGEAWISRRPLDGLDAVLELPALGASLPLAAIHHRVIEP